MRTRQKNENYVVGLFLPLVIVLLLVFYSLGYFGFCCAKHIRHFFFRLKIICQIFIVPNIKSCFFLLFSFIHAKQQTWLANQGNTEPDGRSSQSKQPSSSSSHIVAILTAASATYPASSPPCSPKAVAEARRLVVEAASPSSTSTSSAALSAFTATSVSSNINTSTAVMGSVDKGPLSSSSFSSPVPSHKKKSSVFESGAESRTPIFESERKAAAALERVLDAAVSQSVRGK